jgi:hypothetical protein
MLGDMHIGAASGELGVMPECLHLLEPQGHIPRARRDRPSTISPGRASPLRISSRMNLRVNEIFEETYQTVVENAEEKAHHARMGVVHGSLIAEHCKVEALEHQHSVERSAAAAEPVPGAGGGAS